MKKSIIAAAVCFALGVAGLAVSLPKAAGDAVQLYNESVIGYSGAPYNQHDLASGLTQIKVVSKRSGWTSSVLLRQSSDEKVHFYAYQTPVDEYPIEIQSDGTTAKIIIDRPQRKMIFLNRETVKSYINAEVNYEGSFILEVPPTVTITNTEADGVYLSIEAETTFVNADVIGEYGYIPNESERWQHKYEKMEQQNQNLQNQIEQLQYENEILQETLDNYQSGYYSSAGGLDNEVSEEVQEEELEHIFPADIIRLEGEWEAQRNQFAKSQIDKQTYLKKQYQLSRKIQQAREQQLIEADREDLLPMLLDISSLIDEYNEIDMIILDAQQDYNQGLLTQQQYNQVVQAYEERVKVLTEEIREHKAELANEGYGWDSAVVVNLG